MNRQSIGIIACLWLCAVGGVSTAPAREPKLSSPASPAKGPVIAQVLGEQIHEEGMQPPSYMIESWRDQGQNIDFSSAQYRGQVLAGIVWRRLSARFVEENDIKPTEAEFKTFQTFFATRLAEDPEFLKSLEKRSEELRVLQAEAAASETSPARRDELKVEIEQCRSQLEESSPEGMARRMAELLLPSWKLQQALFKKYGGRAGWQQFGTEAPDAIHAFIQECATRGDFSFVNERDAALFWSNFPGPQDPISFEIDNPADVFESIERYLETQVAEE